MVTCYGLDGATRCEVILVSLLHQGHHDDIEFSRHIKVVSCARSRCRHFSALENGDASGDWLRLLSNHQASSGIQRRIFHVARHGLGLLLAVAHDGWSDYSCRWGRRHTRMQPPRSKPLGLGFVGQQWAPLNGICISYLVLLRFHRHSALIVGLVCSTFLPQPPCKRPVWCHLVSGGRRSNNGTILSCRKYLGPPYGYGHSHSRCTWSV